MKSLHNFNKKSNNSKSISFNSLRFKKFNISVDDSGVHILISANFFKNNNYYVSVHDNILYFKMKQNQSDSYLCSHTLQLNTDKKSMDFQIVLPNKHQRTLKSVIFYDDTVKIQLVQSNKRAYETVFMKSKPMLNQMTAL